MAALPSHIIINYESLCCFIPSIVETHGSKSFILSWLANLCSFVCTAGSSSSHIGASEGICHAHIWRQKYAMDDGLLRSFWKSWLQCMFLQTSGISGPPRSYASGRSLCTRYISPCMFQLIGVWISREQQAHFRLWAAPCHRDLRSASLCLLRHMQLALIVGYYRVKLSVIVWLSSNSAWRSNQRHMSSRYFVHKRMFFKLCGSGLLLLCCSALLLVHVLQCSICLPTWCESYRSTRFN